MTENEVDKFIQPIRKTDLIYQIEDNPPFKEAVFAGLQHLLAIFIAIITPPLLISQALNFTVETTGFLVSMALSYPTSDNLFLNLLIFTVNALSLIYSSLFHKSVINSSLVTIFSRLLSR